MIFKSIQNYRWEKKTVLIVEDDFATIFFLKEILSNTGITILIANNGESAVSMCKENKSIDIILMDMNLPGMDGYEATRQIRKMRKNLPVIAQTAYALIEDLEKCTSSGCDDYVTKPINIFELLAKMEILMS